MSIGASFLQESLFTNPQELTKILMKLISHPEEWAEKIKVHVDQVKLLVDAYKKGEDVKAIYEKWGINNQNVSKENKSRQFLNRFRQNQPQNRGNMGHGFSKDSSFYRVSTYDPANNEIIKSDTLWFEED